MKNIIPKWGRPHLLGFLLTFFIGVQQTQAQLQYDWGDYSIAATDTKFGVPFLQSFTPIHPGVEIGATFLKAEKEKSAHKFGTNIGFFHNSNLANGFYLNGTYTYQRKFKQTIGLGLTAGVGYLYAFSSSDAYLFNPETQQFEQKLSHQGFFIPNVEARISYLKPTKVQPFLAYNWTMLGSPGIFITVLKLGVQIKL